MEIKNPVWLLLLFLLCVALYQCVGKSSAPPPNATQTTVAEDIDYSVIVPPEQLPQFKDTVIYPKVVPEKDPLWMNPPDNDLMPPKDSDDPHTGVM